MNFPACKLSIITINLNNANGLKKTIESVKSQTWKNFEYIIVDGGSTDGSVEVIKKLEAKYNINTNDQSVGPSHDSRNNKQKIINNKLTWLSEPDSGIFNAMNKGINMATGEYTLFLNSGDFFYTNNSLYETFDGRSFTEDFICARCAASKNNKIEFITAPPNNFTFKHFFKASLSHQSTFIKRELFSKHGLYREDLQLKGDWEFFVRTIILENCSTISLNVVLTQYNLDGVSSLAKSREKQEAEMNKIFEETILHKFVPDYNYYTAQLNNMKVYFWADRKKLLRTVNRFVYKMATLATRKK